MEFLLELVLFCFLPIVITSFLLLPESFTVLETGWDFPCTASQHKAISFLEWLNRCIERRRNLISLSPSELARWFISQFVYVLKAASEDRASVRGTEMGDDFIWQHLLLTVYIGTYPFRQPCRPGNLRNRHEIITTNCLKRIGLIHDCLKYINTFYHNDFAHFKGYPIHKGPFLFVWQ